MTEEAIGMMIKQINDTLSKNANNALRKDGLTLSQIGLLLSLDAAPNHEMTLKELEKTHHVSQPTAHGIVKRLAEKKLVVTFDDRDDHRIKHVSLTDAGAAKCQIGRQHMAEAEAMLTCNLSPEEQSIFIKLLKKVRDGML